ncbi:FH2 domain containing 1 [Desulfobacca acetoxidans DSM 11109]|uniref:FH2 domain containing 1 n=1 Tax=Desulfobacca acetoxidans (strain ATCC 700848 / DSM 11109 / ASRB2) TaxID=880072 RepID=F2NE23_DESAR|nr:FH2 domain containing 1 [Desulfobacca acetoxidans DSM 11109]
MICLKRLTQIITNKKNFTIVKIMKLLELFRMAEERQDDGQPGWMTYIKTECICSRVGNVHLRLYASVFMLRCVRQNM